MAVQAPTAIHHRGQQFRFLLIGIGQIFARQFIGRLFPQVLFAVGDKLIDLLQVLAKGSIHCGDVVGAGQLHVGEIVFLLAQNGDRGIEGVILSLKNGLHGSPEQQQRDDQDHGDYRSSCQRAMAE